MSSSTAAALYTGKTDEIQYTAVAAVERGDVVVVGNSMAFATHDIPAGATGALFIGGVWDLPKEAGVAHARGAIVYWDDTNKVVTTTAGSNKSLGLAAAPASAGDSRGKYLSMPAGAVAAGAVSSVFGRTGAVLKQAGDYSVGDITGAAPLNSPAFTGSPTAPTQAPGDNSTKLATTAFVLANAGGGAVSSVFGRTGAILAAAGDYTVSQVTGAAPLNSPAFTGNPTAPTQPVGDNSTKLATTAFVQANAGGGDVKAGTTSYITEVFILDNTRTDGSGLTGLDDTKVVVYYKRYKGTGSVAVPLVASGGVTLGTFAGDATHGALKEIDAAHQPGLYEFHVPDNTLAAGAENVAFTIMDAGANHVAPTALRILLA